MTTSKCFHSARVTQTSPGYTQKYVTSAFPVAIFLQALEASNVCLCQRIHASQSSLCSCYIYLCIFSKLIIEPLSLISSFVISTASYKVCCWSLSTLIFFWSFSFTAIDPGVASFFLPSDSDFLGWGQGTYCLPPTGISCYFLPSVCAFLLFVVVLKNPGFGCRIKSRKSRATNAPQHQDGMWTDLAHSPHILGDLRGLSFSQPPRFQNQKSHASKLPTSFPEIQNTPRPLSAGLLPCPAPHFL